MLYIRPIVLYTFIVTRPNTFKGLQKHLEAVSNEKVALFLFELSWSTEFVIAGFYWIGSIFFTIERTPNQEISSYIVHSVPFILLFGEILLNSIQFQKLHFVLLQPIYISYGVVNWLYVHYALGPIPLYPYVTWDNWQTLFGVVCSETACFVGFMLAYIFGEYKHRRRERSMAASIVDLNCTISTEPLAVETIQTDCLVCNEGISYICQ
eukprot:TRINITY_DN1406_c0_g1_i2.p2 TRINITY_DN1406_c0_g1~~TRINITY_DN1406_c0_g1_i2.p2  ORF type:complete len:209 (-),score=2.92 TRINITY_DN1406_c0_g1_i2:84-710(-)